jgi:hypothetical protein
MTKRNPTSYGLTTVVLLIGIAGCQGTATNSSAYVPNNAQAMNAFIGADATRGRIGPVVSSCGDKVNVTLAGFVNCNFHEKGYAGKFLVTSHLSGVATVSPRSGTRTTKFTVSGLLSGSGFFVVAGDKDHRLRVNVKVGV